MSSVTPIRREAVVDAEPDLAFRVFTEEIGYWWPLAEFSVYGTTSTVVFDSNEIVEIAASGERAVWGAVTDWQPGRLVAFTWHPGRTAERASRVTVGVLAQPRREHALARVSRTGESGHGSRRDAGNLRDPTSPAHAAPVSPR